jgi:hypothetical protein
MRHGVIETSNVSAVTTEHQIATLVSLARKIAEESGSPDGIDFSQLVRRWLSEPHPALGGRAPGDLLKEPGGPDTVAALLERLQSGGYS